MAKMLIELSIDFDTQPFEYDRGPSEQGLLPSAVLREMLKTAKPIDFGVSAAILDPEEGWCNFGIVFPSKGLKKGGKFEYVVNEETCTAHVAVSATLTSTALRKGMEGAIASLGKDFDLRLRGLILKTGPYDGFESFVVGCNKEEPRSWKKILKWSLI
jgi:hypothetical protein